jgi:hypothetical protein
LKIGDVGSASECSTEYYYNRVLVAGTLAQGLSNADSSGSEGQPMKEKGTKSEHPSPLAPVESDKGVKHMVPTKLPKVGSSTSYIDVESGAVVILLPKRMFRSRTSKIREKFWEITRLMPNIRFVVQV